MVPVENAVLSRTQINHNLMNKKRSPTVGKSLNELSWTSCIIGWNYQNLIELKRVISL